MKQVGVSTNVFARIWSLREDGEDNEDAILRRVLWNIDNPGGSATGAKLQIGGPRDSVALPQPQTLEGIVDHRHRVRFSEGFVVERTYLGQPYSAVVRNGRWVIDGLGDEYTRLNELSRAIGTKTENAWVNWFFTDKDGRRRQVSELRDPDSISLRKTGGSTEVGRSREEVEEDSMGGVRVRWCDDVKDALQALGGRASLQSIYRQVEGIRRSAGRSLPLSLDATVRRTLEDFSSDSENFRGEDWFEMAEGKGNGVWALRSKSRSKKLRFRNKVLA